MIFALVDAKSQAAHSQIPYRDSKLTRLLQVGTGLQGAAVSLFPLAPIRAGRSHLRRAGSHVHAVLFGALSGLSVPVTAAVPHSLALRCARQDSLGGNSKTAMVANIVPGAHSYHDTLATLRSLACAWLQRYSYGWAGGRCCRRLSRVGQSPSAEPQRRCGRAPGVPAQMWLWWFIER